MKKETRYTDAYRELQEIVNDLSAGDISVDELSAKVKRAIELIRICKEKLASTDEDIRKILQELGNGS